MLQEQCSEVNARLLSQSSQHFGSSSTVVVMCDVLILLSDPPRILIINLRLAAQDRQIRIQEEPSDLCLSGRSVGFGIQDQLPHTLD